MGTYEIWLKDVKNNEAAIAKGEAVKVDLRDETLRWKPVKAIISKTPTEGTIEALVVHEGGRRGYTEAPEKLYVKIVEELDEEGYVIKDMDAYTQKRVY